MWMDLTFGNGVKLNALAVLPDSCCLLNSPLEKGFDPKVVSAIALACKRSNWGYTRMLQIPNRSLIGPRWQ